MSRTDSKNRAAVLGSPIAHSLSPVLHRAAYAELGLTDWTYDRFEVDEKSLPGFVEKLGPEWAGLSLTMPLKRAVIPLLDEISETATSVEAVNTLVFTEDGQPARRQHRHPRDRRRPAGARHRAGGVGGHSRRGSHRLLRAGRARPDLHR